MADSTSRDRVLAALRCQQPDRVPFVEVAVERPIARAALGLPDRPTRGQDDAGTLVPLSGMFGYPEEEDLALARGLGLDALGMFLWAPVEVVERQVDGHTMVIGGKIKSRCDLARIRLPDPDDPALYEPYRQFVASYRDSGLALFCYSTLGSHAAIQGMGTETFCYALHDDRALVEEVFEFYAGWYAQVSAHLCTLGFDFLWFGDDIAYKSAPFVSPRVFRSLFMPNYRKVADRLTLPWIFHSDGNLMPILDDLLTLGPAGLHPIEPGAMDLGEIKRRYGRRICLCGHISVDTLGRGTPDEVDALVCEAIRVAGRGGGYIVGSSNSITWYCQPANVLAMRDAVARYGRY